MDTKQKYFIIDFDRTFVQLESLDELAGIALKKDPQKKEIIRQIGDITEQGMQGEITFPVSLEKRLSLFQPTQSHINALIKLLKKNITPSVLRNKDFFLSHANNIYIISGGFTEYILPIVKPFGIAKDHILANTFLFAKDGKIVGYDTKNVLAQEQGKVKAIRKLHIEGNMYVLGDGYTDFEIKEMGAAKNFHVFTENIARESLIKQADHVIPNLDEFLYLFHMPRSLSYPKNRMKVLLLENISQFALDRFKEEGFDVELFKKSFSEEELKQKISDISILGIRSKTKITNEVLAHAKKLLTVGTFSIGVERIDLQACSQYGVAVFNAPYSNTRSVAELVLGEMIMLMRHTFEKNTKMHQGAWEKISTGAHEIRGKKLGIIGYGHIGTQLSVMAECLGMEIYFYNTTETLAMGNAKSCKNMEEVLKIADVVTIHVDGRPSNKNLISDKQFQQMKEGVIFINSSRGFVVDLQALGKYIKNGKVRGAAIDVYITEPQNSIDTFSIPLQGLPNIILTPHIASGTEEAQEHIGKFVSQKLIDYINTGDTTLSVNFPNLQLPQVKASHRFIHIHKNVPGILAEINSTLAKHKTNIEGQYLQTTQDIGYVITDVYKEYDKAVIKELKEIKETVKFRVLY